MSGGTLTARAMHVGAQDAWMGRPANTAARYLAQELGVSRLAVTGAVRRAYADGYYQAERASR